MDLTVINHQDDNDEISDVALPGVCDTVFCSVVSSASLSSRRLSVINELGPIYQSLVIAPYQPGTGLLAVNCRVLLSVGKDQNLGGESSMLNS